MTARKSSASTPALRSLEEAVAIDGGRGCAPAASAACCARLQQHVDKHGAYAALVSPTLNHSTESRTKMRKVRRARTRGGKPCGHTCDGGTGGGLRVVAYRSRGAEGRVVP